MKKTILYILLIISSVALSACSGERNVAVQTPQRFDWFGAFMKGEELPKGWLCTERTQFAIDNYGAKIDPFYLIGDDFYVGIPESFASPDLAFIEAHISGLNREKGVNIYRSYFKLREKDAKTRLPVVEEFEYTADVKIEANDDVDIDPCSFTEERRDSLLDAFLGRLVVDVTITSIEGKPCSVHIPLIDCHLSQPVSNPIHLSYFLYKAIENGGEWQVSSSMIELKECIDSIIETYS